MGRQAPHRVTTVLALWVIALALVVIAAAHVVAFLNLVHQRRTPMVDQPTNDVVAQLAAARAAYDAKIASEAAAAVAPVQAQLDTANATIATLNQTIADNLAAVKAEADTQTADSAPVGSVSV